MAESIIANCSKANKYNNQQISTREMMRACGILVSCQEMWNIAEYCRLVCHQCAMERGRVATPSPGYTVVKERCKAVVISTTPSSARARLTHPGHPWPACAACQRGTAYRSSLTRAGTRLAVGLCAAPCDDSPLGFSFLHAWCSVLHFRARSESRS